MIRTNSFHFISDWQFIDFCALCWFFNHQFLKLYIFIICQLVFYSWRTWSTSSVLMFVFVLGCSFFELLSSWGLDDDDVIHRCCRCWCWCAATVTIGILVFVIKPAWRLILILILFRTVSTAVKVETVALLVANNEATRCWRWWWRFIDNNLRVHTPTLPQIEEPIMLMLPTVQYNSSFLLINYERTSLYVIVIQQLSICVLLF